MGIHNREYLRDDDGPSGHFSGGSPPAGGSFFSTAIGILVLLNGIIFLVDFAQILPLNQWLQLPATFEVVGDAGAEVVLPPPPSGQPPVALSPGTYIRRLPGKFTKNPGAYSKVRFAQSSHESSAFNVGQAVVEVDALRSIAWQLPWRIVTYGFCHDKSSPLHIIFNMFVLWMFGRLIESIYGRREFLCFFLAGIVASAACHLALQQFLGDVIPVIGASGGVMAVTIIAAMHYPRMQVRLLFFPFFPIQMRYMAIGIVVMDALGLFNSGSSTAHAAHLGGAAFGFLYHRFDWRISGILIRLSGLAGYWKKRAARPQVKVYRPPVDGLDDQVDAILEKISRDGEESLTDRERRTLIEASRRKRGEL